MNQYDAYLEFITRFYRFKPDVNRKEVLRRKRATRAWVWTSQESSELLNFYWAFRLTVTQNSFFSFHFICLPKYLYLFDVTLYFNCNQLLNASQIFPLSQTP